MDKIVELKSKIKKEILANNINQVEVYKRMGLTKASFFERMKNGKKLEHIYEILKKVQEIKAEK